MLAGELGQVDPYQQQSKVSCSFATMLAVLRHYGIEQYTEAELAPLVGLTSQGAWPYQIVAACTKLGLNAFELRLQSLADAQNYLAAGIPLIAEVSSWNLPGRGHFVVLVAMDAKVAEVMDPNVPGNWRTLTLAELYERWAPHEYACVAILPPR